MTYVESKQKVIDALKENSLTLVQMSALVNMQTSRIHSLIQNIRNNYEVETITIGARGMKSYRIIGQKNKIVLNLYNFVPITALAKKIHKLDLIQWNIDNPVFRFPTSRDLVEKAKSEGIKVFEYDNYGRMKFL